MNMVAEAEKMQEDFRDAIDLIRRIALETHINRCRNDINESVDDAYYDITHECQDFLEDRDL